MNKLIVVLVLAVLLMFAEKLPDVEVKKIPLSKPTPVEMFMSKVAAIESGGNHSVVNEFGMMGKYQFSPATVRVLGFKVSPQQFLRNPKLQDSVMYRYMKVNHRELEPLIDRYDGKVVNGVKITRAAILAGAHFAGSHGVKSYLTNNGVNVTDARGTTLTKYMKYFSNFQLPRI